MGVMLNSMQNKETCHCLHVHQQNLELKLLLQVLAGIGCHQVAPVPGAGAFCGCLHCGCHAGQHAEQGPVRYDAFHKHPFAICSALYHARSPGLRQIVGLSIPSCAMAAMFKLLFCVATLVTLVLKACHHGHISSISMDLGMTLGILEVNIAVCGIQLP